MYWFLSFLDLSFSFMLSSLRRHAGYDLFMRPVFKITHRIIVGKGERESCLCVKHA